MGRMVIVVAWVLAFLPTFLPLLNLYGFNGLECKTRKCTILIDNKGRNAKHLLGSIVFAVTASLMLGFHFAIFGKLKVSFVTNTFAE